MLDGHHDERAADPHTVAAIGESFMVLLEKNKPDKSYVMEKGTYDRYLAVLSNDQIAIPISSKLKFSNRKRFKVLYKDNSPYLARAKSNKRVYHREEIFDVIFAAHCSCNHGDARKTYSIVKEYADNIFYWECVLVTKLCYCKRVKGRTSELVSASKPMTKAGDVHLFDMESISDNDYQWILLYRDEDTKFLFARPLKSRNYDEIMLALFYIFLDHGPPLFLNTSLSKKFILKLLHKMYLVWPGCPTVYGQQLQSDNHTEFMKNLEEWMKVLKSNSWTIGAAFVTASLNAKESRTLGSAPYALMHRTTLEKYATKYHHQAEEVSNDEEDSHESEGDVDEVYREVSVQPSDQRYCDAPDVGNICQSEFVQGNGSTDYSIDFPTCESEDIVYSELIQFLSRVRIIDNPGKGECLFYVIRQHLKVFTLLEYRLDSLRRMIAEFLLINQLGKEFLRRYHPDIDAHALSINTGTRSSWGGPETLLAISQLFNLQVTVLSFVRKGTAPYITKYWPVSDVPPPRDTLSEPTANNMVVRFQNLHYTLLLPHDIPYPPRRFKRERSSRCDGEYRDATSYLEPYTSSFVESYK